MNTPAQFIEFYQKNIYGNNTLYFADKKIQETMKLITNQVTISPRVKEGLERLGFGFIEVLAPRA